MPNAMPRAMFTFRVTSDGASISWAWVHRRCARTALASSRMTGVVKNHTKDITMATVALDLRREKASCRS